jgi:hypothetical protein
MNIKQHGSYVFKNVTGNMYDKISGLKNNGSPLSYGPSPSLTGRRAELQFHAVILYKYCMLGIQPILFIFFFYNRSS